MIKKKVLVHGSLKSLNEFFNSPSSLEFEPLAILTDESEKVTVISRNPARGGVET